MATKGFHFYTKMAIIVRHGRTFPKTPPDTAQEQYINPVTVRFLKPNPTATPTNSQVGNMKTDETKDHG